MFYNQPFLQRKKNNKGLFLLLFFPILSASALGMIENKSKKSISNLGGLYKAEKKKAKKGETLKATTRH